MREHTFKIDFDGQEGAMIRLLGLIQRRGFSIEGMEMPKKEGQMKTITLTVKPLAECYRADVLQRQIERLQEVREVKAVMPGKAARRMPEFLRRPVAQVERALFTQEQDACL
jgi:acetolactate synthase II small subunit